MGYSGIMVGYGPEFDDSVGLSQIRHKIDEKFICEGIYDPERVPKGEQSRQVEITLPNRIHESLICGSDTSTDAFGACPGYKLIFKQNVSKMKSNHLALLLLILSLYITERS